MNKDEIKKNVDAEIKKFLENHSNMPKSKLMKNWIRILKLLFNYNTEKGMKEYAVINMGHKDLYFKYSLPFTKWLLEVFNIHISRKKRMDNKFSLIKIKSSRRPVIIEGEGLIVSVNSILVKNILEAEERKKVNSFNLNLSDYGTA